MAPAADGLKPRVAWWWPAAGLVLLAAALPATALRAVALLDDPSPRSLAAGVPAVAAVWAWLLLRRAAPRSEAGRPFGALVVLATAIGLAALASTAGAPEQRLVLLAPLAAGLVLAHGGTALLAHLAGPLALLLLAWPWPHELVARLSTPALLALGGKLGAGLAAWGGAEIAPAGQPGMWRLLTPVGPQLAGLDASCSGASGLMALPVLALPVLALHRPPWRRAAIWLGLGLLVVLLGNGLRIGALFWLGAVRGFDEVFAQVHRHAGSALVLLTWLGMLAGLPLLGAPRPSAMPPAPLPPRGSWPLMACLPALALCAVLDFAAAPPPVRPAPRSPPPVMVEPAPEPLLERPRPAAPEPVPVPVPVPAAPAEPPAPAPVPAKPGPLAPLDLLPAVTGWKRWAHGSFPWAAGMFGAQARAERLVYQRGAAGRLLWIDVLVHPELAAIERHTVAGCFGSHAYTVERSEGQVVAGVALGLWVVGDGSGLRWAVAAWTQPAVQLGGAPTARRIIIWRRIDAGNGDSELAEVEILANALLAAEGD